MSSLLLNPEKRDIVLDSLFDYGEDITRDQLDELMTRFNVCLTTINSDNYIDIDNFELYCKQTQIRLRQILPWMEISTTIHMLLAHGPQFIRANGNRGLLQYSESPLEVLNSSCGVSLVSRVYLSVKFLA